MGKARIKISYYYIMQTKLVKVPTQTLKETGVFGTYNPGGGGGALTYIGSIGMCGP